ncbi:MAG: hypothetical protein ACO1RX_04755 [Candidatus Sericytochromatia bacterium]
MLNRTSCILLGGLLLLSACQATPPTVTPQPSVSPSVQPSPSATPSASPSPVATPRPAPLPVTLDLAIAPMTALSPYYPVEVRVYRGDSTTPVVAKKVLPHVELNGLRLQPPGLVTGESYRVQLNGRDNSDSCTNTLSFFFAEGEGTAEVSRVATQAVIPLTGADFVAERYRDLSCSIAYTLLMQVQDEDGNDIKGAAVTAEVLSPDNSVLYKNQQSSDVDGNLRLRSLPSGLAVRLSVQHPDYSTHEEFFTPPQGPAAGLDQQLTLRLK